MIIISFAPEYLYLVSAKLHAFPMSLSKLSFSIIILMSSTYPCKHGSMQMLNSRNHHLWKADMIFLQCENALNIALGREDPPN